MEFSVKRADLVHGLQLVQGVVERRSTLPILAHVLIEPAEDGLALMATDMEVGLRTRVPGVVKTKGILTVGARKLYEIAREIAAEEMTIRTVSAGWVEVLAGRSKFKVVSLDPKDFPPLPLGTPESGGVTLRIATGTLREMIDKTLFAVSSDETRFNLSGVYAESGENGALRMVATDGHRLAMIERSLADARLPRGSILPRKGLSEIRKLLDEPADDELTLNVADKHIRLHTPAVSSFMRLVEGEFPDYRQVIPSAPRVKALINRDDMLAALRRMSLLASERSHGVRVHLEKGRLEVSASNPDQGEASEDIEVSYAGEPLSVGFNARYLLDVLGVHAPGDVIEFGLTDEVGPGVLRGSQDPEYTYVIMPMRL
jgi:DNA polymerase-3 subunit beta